MQRVQIILVTRCKLLSSNLALVPTFGRTAFALGVMSRSSFVPGVATDGGAETELHGVAWTGEVGRARELVTGGSDVNHIDSAGETPLHGAAANGNTEMVGYLLSVGARVDIPGTNEMTPLHWARWSVSSEPMRWASNGRY